MKGEVKHILDSLYETKLTAIACFFSAAKFNEIYPPCLHDFNFEQEEFISGQAIIERELEIFKSTNCNYNFSFLTDWFNLYCEGKIPEWGYFCYLYAPFAKNEDLALAIIQVNESGVSDWKIKDIMTKVL